MKLNQIGFNKSTSLLSWSDNFLSDFGGNRLRPVWDASIVGGNPILPNIFTPDMTNPTLDFWFYDHENNQFHLSFDEPVQINNMTSFVAWENKPLLSTFFYKFTTVTSVAPSSNDPKEFVVTLNNFCLNNTMPLRFCSGNTFFDKMRTSTSKFYITCSPEAAVDLAQIPNSINEIVVANPVEEGSPDCSPCDVGYFVATNCTSSRSRICAPCTECRVGQWAREMCTEYRDTGCTGECHLLLVFMCTFVPNFVNFVTFYFLFFFRNK
jgi:hypothetical protein